MLTAGLGRRMEPFSKKCPKPCLPFINLPLMNYGFYLARQAGFKRFLFNTHHLTEKLKPQLQKLKNHCFSVDISDESSQLLGSGGALWKARRYLEKEEFFLVANADSVLIPGNKEIFTKFVDHFQREKSLCSLLTCHHPELLKSLNPIWINDKGNVIDFSRKPSREDSKPLHYTGYKIFSSRIFDFLPKGESHIFDILSKAISVGERVSHFLLPNAFWYETGNFKSFLKASLEVTQNHWKWLSEVHSFYGQSLCKQEKSKKDILVCSEEQRHQKLPSFEGFNVIGRGVKIPQGVHLKNVIVGDGCQLKSNQTLENQFVLS